MSAITYAWSLLSVATLSCAMGLDEQTTDELRATLRQLTAAVNAVAS